MKYLYSWLKEYYPTIPAIEDLEPLLIQIGHDVESIDRLTWDGVVVAEVVAVEKHPNADKLSLVTIKTVDGEQTIVCGAPNVATGQKVAYATPGTTLPCGITIRTAKVRGIESNGMLCAEDELGIGSSHDGLLLFTSEATIGDTLTRYVAEDAVISLDITPNRGDVLSHFGLARDIAASHNGTVLTPTWSPPTYSGNTNEYVTIGEIHSDVMSISFGAISNIDASTTSPLMMRSRLFLLGQKSINLATDITNYLLLAYGQPLHAYDAATLTQTASMGVRRAKDGEALTALNGTTYNLTPQSLVITSNDAPVALAGVMGGNNTKVTDTTNDVVFECAVFNPKATTVMSRGIGLHTESSVRYERGIDPTLRLHVLAEAQSMLQALAGGVCAIPIDRTISSNEPIATEVPIDLFSKRIGKPIEMETIRTILGGLGCVVANEADGTITIEAPAWRFDLRLPEDYIEEVARMIGLQNVPKTPLSATVPQGKRAIYWRRESFKDVLTSLGAYEISTYPFMNESEVTAAKMTETAPKLCLAPVEDKQYMRTTLVPGMLTAIANNPETPSFTLFEVAKTFRGNDEQWMVCIATASGSEKDNDHWWQNLFERLRLPVSSWMGRVRTATDEQKGEYKIRKNSVMILEEPVDALPFIASSDILPVAIPDLDAINYTPLSKFQASRRDIAFVTNTTHAPQTIADELLALDPYIITVELFDVFQDAQKIGEGKQSLAYHIMYQSPEHTLTTNEINTIHTKLETYIKEHYHGTIR